MDTFAQVLRDGMRLALLRRPRRTPVDAGFGSFAVFFLAGVLADAAWQWPLVDAPRMVNDAGVQSALAGGLLRLAAAALLGAASGRRAIFWTIAAWLEAAFLLVALFTGPLYLLDRHVDFPLGYFVWIGGIAWLLLILLRLATFLAGKAKVRGAAAALVAFALVVGPWMVLEPQGPWRTDVPDPALSGDYVAQPGELDEPETAMYAQGPLLDAALSRLAPQRPGHVDLYGVAFGGDAGEDVFRNEVDYFERLLATRFDAAGRVLALLNHPDRAATNPLATATNLERALRGVARRMDVVEDVLFLYLTSHGTEDHWIYVNQPPLPLDPIDPRRLREALEASGIRWRVLVVSTCYSGGFVESLRDPRTLVLTASRADRSSFGCGADSDITYFGNAFLAQGLNRTTDFVEAFSIAKRLVAEWERAEDFPASEPQMAEGAHIGERLTAWRAGFRPGPVVEFKPPAD